MSSVVWDHWAYRFADRDKAAKHWVDVFGYKIVDELEPFPNTRSYALRHPDMDDLLQWNLGLGEYVHTSIPWTVGFYHMPPEIFISDGKPGSVIHDWVHKERGGLGGLHHKAINVENLEEAMAEFSVDHGYNFLSDIIESPGIRQVFSEEIPALGNLIIELIERNVGQNFIGMNVAELMKSTMNRKSAQNSSE